MRTRWIRRQFEVLSFSLPLFDGKTHLSRPNVTLVRAGAGTANMQGNGWFDDMLFSHPVDANVGRQQMRAYCVLLRPVISAQLLQESTWGSSSPRARRPSGPS